MRNFIKPLKIGGVECPNNLVLAPMAGISDPPFRRMCIKSGAGLVVAEMVSALALKHGSAKTGRMLRIFPGEHPVSMQIFGSDPGAIAEAALMAAESGADIVDINAGCPVNKILKSGSGALLMKDENKFSAVVAAAVKAVKIPVTVKIRTGWVKSKVISPALARIAMNEGASAVAVHGRPAEAMHSGPVDLDGIAATAAAVAIPVIGNGGIKKPEDAGAMFATGCSGVMIGRGAVGNPGIFREIADHFIRPGDVRISVPKERIAAFLGFLEENAGYYGDVRGVIRARKVAGYWLKDFSGASSVRAEFMKAGSLQEAKSILLKYRNNKGCQVHASGFNG